MKEPRPDHDFGPPAGKQVDRGKLLIHPHRIVGAEYRHRAGQADVLGACRRRRHNHGRRRRYVIRSMVFPDAEDVEAELVRQLDFLHQVAQPLLGRKHDAGPRERSGFDEGYKS